MLDNLAEDGKGEYCEIETMELVELIHIWLNKRKEYKKDKNKGCNNLNNWPLHEKSTLFFIHKGY